MKLQINIEEKEEKFYFFKLGNLVKGEHLSHKRDILSILAMCTCCWEKKCLIVLCMSTKQDLLSEQGQQFLDN